MFLTLMLKMWSKNVTRSELAAGEILCFARGEAC
jgi:hypothetical protein